LVSGLEEFTYASAIEDSVTVVEPMAGVAFALEGEKYNRDAARTTAARARNRLFGML
jgi:hypothetical protein